MSDTATKTYVSVPIYFLAKLAARLGTQAAASRAVGYSGGGLTKPFQLGEVSLTAELAAKAVLAELDVNAPKPRSDEDLADDLRASHAQLLARGYEVLVDKTVAIGKNVVTTNWVDL